MHECRLPVTLRDLGREDLPHCGWSGPLSHLRHVAGALDRAHAGEVEYLAACGPAGTPLGLCGVDFVADSEISGGGTAPGGGGTSRRLTPGSAAWLWQLVVMPALQGCGIGTLLVREAERRVVRRGLPYAALAVGEDNVRARALYARLGYVRVGTVVDRWTEVHDDGTRVEHADRCLALARRVAD